MSLVLNPTLEDRIRGVFYGQAIGDALGNATEFMSKRRVELTFPEGLSCFSQFESAFLWESGEWTDDTEQALCLAHSLHSCGGVDVVDFARRLRYWAHMDGRGIGNLTADVIWAKGFMASPHKAARTIWEAGGKQVATNGAVMRTAPVGVWDFRRLERVVLNAATLCNVTHADPRCAASCAAVSTAIASLLQGAKLRSSISRAQACATGFDSAGIVKWFDLSDGPLEALKLSRGAIGFTYKTMAAGFWALKHDSTFIEGLLPIVNEGGDADTNGAVTGALLGARFGLSGIPPELIGGLKHKERLEEVIALFLEGSLTDFEG